MCFRRHIERIISTAPHKEKKRWMEIMLESEDEKLHSIAQFFITLGVLAKEKTAEEIIDLITGITIEKNADQSFQSPYKNFYFQTSELQTTSLEYLDRLQSLQSFIQELRAYKGIGVLSLSDAIEFLDLHEKHRLSLYYKSNFNNDKTAVNLITAHGAKGLEFENVYIINCEEEEWIKKGNLNKITFPTNLHLHQKTKTSTTNSASFT
jgi:superfamily I DNA/RNA helicase